MDAHRKKRLEQLIAAEPYNGDRPAFIKASKLSKGRITQMLDPTEPFGERSARSLAKALQLPDDRWFDKGGIGNAPEWPFVSVTPEQFYSLSTEVRRAAEAVLRSALPVSDVKKDSRSKPQRAA